MVLVVFTGQETPLARQQRTASDVVSRLATSPEPRRYRVIAIGESAGGLHSAISLLRPLPRDLPCAILIVQHLSPEHRSMMAELLAHKTCLKVRQAEDSEPIVDGVVYIGPPGFHLVAEPGKVRLLATPALRLHRPSVDLMFESVAVNYGRHAIGIVLSGSGSDGAIGIRAIKMAGGVTITEDPGKAEFSSMPYAAIATGCVDMVLPLDTMGQTITQLCSQVNDDPGHIA